MEAGDDGGLEEPRRVPVSVPRATSSSREGAFSADLRMLTAVCRRVMPCVVTCSRLTSPGALVGVVWGSPLRRVVTAVRRDADVKADRSVSFTSDRVAVRGSCRVGFGFPTRPLWSACG